MMRSAAICLIALGGFQLVAGQGAAGYASRADIPSGCELPAGSKLPDDSRCLFNDQCQSGFCCPYYRNCQGAIIGDWTKDALMLEVLADKSIGGQGTNACHGQWCYACAFGTPNGGANSGTDMCTMVDAGSGEQVVLTTSESWIINFMGLWDITNAACMCDSRFLAYMESGEWVPECGTVSTADSGEGTPAPSSGGGDATPAPPTPAPTQTTAAKVVTTGCAIQVDDPAAFAASASARSAFQKTYADLADVPTDQVVVTLTVARRLEASGRMLAGTVNVEAEITVAEASSSYVANTVTNVGTSTLQTNAASNLQAAGVSQAVTVQAITAASIADTSVTLTVTQQPGNDGGSGNGPPEISTTPSPQMKAASSDARRIWSVPAAALLSASGVLVAC